MNTLNQAIFLLCTATLFGCGGGGESDSATPSVNNSPCSNFDCTAMLTDIANNVLVPTYNDMLTNANALQTSVDSYCEDVNDAARLTAAQEAWLAAMATWQQVEIMQVGPLSELSNALRDNVYSWPIVSQCGVDQDIVMANTDSSYDIQARTPDRKGLDAIEYVLFANSLNHTCAANIATTADWNNLDDSDKQAQRCVYLSQAANDVANNAQSLVDAWNGTSGDYLTTLTDVGAGKRFLTIEAAVNHMSDALFYIETQTKDIKFRLPLGFDSNSCGNAGTTCVEDVESPLSMTSKQHILNNITALQAMYRGNLDGEPAGIGFDDYLDAAGDTNVSAMMEQDLSLAILAVSDAQMPNSLSATIQNNVELAESAHDALKAVTDRLKLDFISVLGLTIPSGAAGDSD